MADELESAYMVGGASVRHTDKRVSRSIAATLGVWAPFCWALALFIGLTNATSDKPVPAGVPTQGTAEASSAVSSWLSIPAACVPAAAARMAACARDARSPAA